MDIMILRALRDTLNQISVSGSDNLNRLLGCIQTLDRMLEAAKHAETGGAEHVCDQ